MILDFFFFTFPKKWVGRAMGNETFHGDGLKKDSLLVYVVKFLWNVAGRCGSFSGKGQRLG